MASILHSISLILFFVFLLFANPTFSADSPESSPSPSPQLPPVAISAPPESISPSPALPLSPPDLAPNSPSPAPEHDGASSDSQNYPSPVPAPTPDVAADVHDDTNAADLETKQSGGMNGGEKFGIALGVIGAACLVGLGAVVYKKRQQNIRRAQYKYASTRRSDIL